IRNPNNILVVGAALVGSEIPVFGVAEASGVAIEECKLGAFVVPVGVHVVLLRDGCAFAVIEQPDHLGGLANGRVPDRRVVRARPVDVFVEAVMKEVVAIAAVGIGRTNPNRLLRRDVGVSAPGQLVVR